MKKSLGANVHLQPAPVWIVGSYIEEDKPNIMTASWSGICNSSPPCVYVSLQKTRSSYQGILDHNAFTINIPSSSQMKEADYIGIVKGKNTDKFADTKFTPVKSEVVNAPYVEECPLVIECKVINKVELGSHTMFIGQIIDTKADESVLNPEGNPDMSKIDPFLFSTGEMDYYKIGEKFSKAFIYKNLEN